MKTDAYISENGSLFNNIFVLNQAIHDNTNRLEVTFCFAKSTY